MTQPKKLIEVAMPIKEISAESVRDKSIRNGHISTLHLWWARRPLPVCRAMVFASLVPDPLDENCPQVFRDAIEILLGSTNKPLIEKGIPSDAYKPYDDIPYTAAIDSMEDNYRNRLMMFIGKFSKEYSANEKAGKATPTAKQISEYSLIRWENKNNETIINKARKLIWVSHNSNSNDNVQNLLHDFDVALSTIKNAENDLYSIVDRCKVQKVSSQDEVLQKSIRVFLNKMPKVFDPFAGGGAIPLEAARLGCNSYGNDINLVAHIIQKGSLEFPQKFGKPIIYSKAEFIERYGKQEFDKVPYENKSFVKGEATKANIMNRLSFDVNYYSDLIIKVTAKDFEYLYPNNKNKLTPLVYYWGRIGNCSNPTCKAEVPLLRQFYLSKRRNYSEIDWYYLSPEITGNKIAFKVKRGKCEVAAWNSEGNLTCPCCGNITKVSEIKKQFNTGGIKEKLLAIIYEDKDGKRTYLSPDVELPKVNGDSIRPKELMPTNDSQNVKVPLWGIKKWGDLFNERQIVVINGLIDNYKNLLKQLEGKNEPDYNNALATYLAILIDRVITRYNNINVWHNLQETVEHPFGNKSISMVFDYPEMNPFSSLSGSAYAQVEAIVKVIEQESHTFNFSYCVNTSSGLHQQFASKEINAVVTDPPYYDAIAYADLSDFFYVWLKRTLGNIYPYNFSTPLTPKSEECTAIKAHFEGDKTKAEKHFEGTLSSIFKNVEQQTKDIVSIMFAHQSTKAWTTLCNSILESKMNITGSWAIDGLSYIPFSFSVR